jgi:hypothetical protein
MLESIIGASDSHPTRVPINITCWNPSSVQVTLIQQEFLSTSHAGIHHWCK